MKIHIVCIFTLLLFASRLFAQVQLEPEAFYKIENIATRKMIEIEDAVFSRGTKVQQYFNYETNGICDGKNQRWMFIPSGLVNGEQSFYIINNGFMKYLQAGAETTAQHGDLSLDNIQRWVLRPTAEDGVFFIKSIDADRFLEVPFGNINDGAQMTVNSFFGDEWQQFRLSVHDFVQLPSGFFSIRPQIAASMDLNITGGAADDGTPIQLYYATPSALNDHWRFIPTFDGYFKIQSLLGDMKTIDVVGWGAGIHSNLIIWGSANVEKQKWLIMPVGREPNTYVFFNKESGLCIDVAGGLPANHATIQTYLFMDQNNQKWWVW